MKTVTKNGKKKLQKKYNATKYNQLNEVPVPVLPDITNNNIDNNLYNNKKRMEFVYDNNNLDNTAAAVRSRPSYRVKKHKKSNDDLNTNNNNDDANLKRNENNNNNNRQQKRNKKKRKNHDDGKLTNNNNTTTTVRNDLERKRKYKTKNFNGMKWKSYYDKSTISPLHPRRIIQEFTY